MENKSFNIGDKVFIVDGNNCFMSKRQDGKDYVITDKWTDTEGSLTFSINEEFQNAFYFSDDEKYLISYDNNMKLFSTDIDAYAQIDLNRLRYLADHITDKDLANLTMKERIIFARLFNYSWQNERPIEKSID